jgi:uncharacterized membrane protein
MVLSAQMLVFVGLGLSVTSTTFSNFGQNIQKYAFMKYAKQHGNSSQPSQYKLWRWWVGLGFVIVGALFDFVALKFAPQSVIMPAGAISLGINPFFASMWLGEKFTAGDVQGTLLILVGAAGVACSYAVLGNVQEKEYTLKQLLDLYSRPVMCVYAVFVAALFRYLMRLMKHCENLRAESKKTDDENGVISNGVVAGKDSVVMESGVLKSPAGEQCVDGPVEYAQLEQWHPITYGALSGIFGAQSVLFAKSTVELISTSVSKTNQFDSPFAFCVVICMLLSIAGQTHFLAEGLKHFDALIIVPVFQCFLITFSILGGATYFEELYGFSLHQWILFVISVATAIYGVIVLAKSRPVSSSDRKVVCADEYSDDSVTNHHVLEMARLSHASVEQSPAVKNNRITSNDGSSEVNTMDKLGDQGETKLADRANGGQSTKVNGCDDHTGDSFALKLSLKQEHGDWDGLFDFSPLWAGGVVQRQTSTGGLSPDHFSKEQGAIIYI